MALYGVTSDTTLTAASTKSLILLNPVTVAFKLRQIDISLDASAAAAGVKFQVYRVSTIGTPAGTTATPWLADERDVAATTTALTNLTAEPTTVGVLCSYYLQPLGGLYTLPLPFSAEIIGKGGGNRIGLRYTTPAAVAPDVIATAWFEE